MFILVKHFRENEIKHVFQSKTFFHLSDNLHTSCLGTSKGVAAFTDCPLEHFNVVQMLCKNFLLCQLFYKSDIHKDNKELFT